MKKWFDLLGKILMILGILVFVILSVWGGIWSAGEDNCSGIFCVYYVVVFFWFVYVVPFLLGLVLWIISKFFKK